MFIHYHFFLPSCGAASEATHGTPTMTWAVRVCDGRSGSFPSTSAWFDSPFPFVASPMPLPARVPGGGLPPSRSRDTSAPHFRSAG